MSGGEIEACAGFCRLLADENRLRILFALKGGQKSVSSVMAATELSQTLVSYHLRTLREQRLVAAERRGPFVLYRLTNEEVLVWVAQANRFWGLHGIKQRPVDATKTDANSRSRESKGS